MGISNLGLNRGSSEQRERFSVNCTNCGAQIAPGARFCTECGRPLAAAGQAPVPPQPPAFTPNVPPRPPVPGPGPSAVPPMPPTFNQPVPPQPPAFNQPMPPRPPVPGPGPAAVPPAPPVMNQPPAFAPAVPPTPPAPPTNVANQAAPAVAVAGPSLLGIPATEIIRAATVGDLYNNGQPVAVMVTDNYLVLVPQGGAPVVEEVPGIRHAVVGDYDGDGTEDLALFSDTHVWVSRYSQMGSVRSGKVALQTLPQHLVRAPFTSDGRAVLMATSDEKISFYVLHPSRGLVEIAATPVPAIEA